MVLPLLFAKYIKQAWMLYSVSRSLNCALLALMLGIASDIFHSRDSHAFCGVLFTNTPAPSHYDRSTRSSGR
ncbi:hypothetical protein HD806DRAFT_504130 [Xylariaceae sp. AK1471]|nr:hypothetical protein HD806DRAFT_504130 [Xylariaceae sp. AK1471]